MFYFWCWHSLAFILNISAIWKCGRGLCHLMFSCYEIWSIGPVLSCRRLFLLIKLFRPSTLSPLGSLVLLFWNSCCSWNFCRDKLHAILSWQVDTHVSTYDHSLWFRSPSDSLLSLIIWTLIALYFCNAFVLSSPNQTMEIHLLDINGPVRCVSGTCMPSVFNLEQIYLYRS